MQHRYLLLLTAFGSIAACSSSVATLHPAPGASAASAPGNGAATTVDGVRVVASAEAWQWDPPDLKTKATPLLLELQNDGSRSVLIRYNQITLTDADGHRFNAMPPYDIKGTLSEAYTVQNPYYGFSNFTVAPYLSRWYPRFSRFGGTFAYDDSYYSPYYTQYQRVRLPTAEMVQRALPEGVLAPGGRAMGFVYFEAMDKDARTVTLAVRLTDAQTNSSIGTASIPFVTK
ncbi:MAG: hypothetical protein JWM95_4781 [Gemmatimonadetes bacterium]|nr:hypothetical protein [Gemmatimonadota bacterium]